MPIEIDNQTHLLAHFGEKLKPIQPFLAKHDSIEKLEKVPEIRELLEEIEEYCLQKGIVGYHYTRAFPDEIREKGLLLTNGDDRRAMFLERFGELFAPDQEKRIKSIWSRYFDRYMKKIRDNTIWFNFTPGALHNGGADRLLRYFGGENIYMPLTEDGEIEAIIRTIGTPLIVKCHLNARSLETFASTIWAKIWLSSYHCKINKKAYPVDTDAYSKQQIGAERIIEIRDASEYLRND